MIGYPDTSFLAALYMLDANSSQAARRMQKQLGDVFLLSDLAELELMNAFQQRLFRKELATGEVSTAQRFFLDDLHSGVWQRKAAAAGAVHQRALQLARKWTATLGTRTLDILHVAVALELGVDLFFTFDQRQTKLARVAGLRVT